MTGTDRHVDSRAAYEAWTEHQWFAYRGCAPDPDEPRLAAGGVVREGKRVRVPLDAWCGEDRDGPERQADRVRRQHAAIEVCLRCPVMVQCDRYAFANYRRRGLVLPPRIRARGESVTVERLRLSARGRASA